MAEVQQALAAVAAAGYQKAADVLALVSGNSLSLIATKTSIAGNAIADSNMVWQAGKTFATHIPILTFAICNSGTLTLTAFTLKADTVVISGSALLTSLSSAGIATVVPHILGALSVDPSKFIVVSVTAASVGASNFGVYTYGIPRPT